MNYFEILILAIALSLDSFAIALSYGINKTKIAQITILIISLISSLILCASFVAGGLLRSVVSANITSVCSFLMLFLLGLYKLLQKPQKVKIKELNIRESLIMGVSMSIDSLAAGIGAGITEKQIPFALLLVFVTGYLTFCFGNFVGFKLSSALKLDVSKLGSVMIIALSFTKLRIA